MHPFHISTITPSLARGEPACPEADTLPAIARAVILAAAGGSLRRCGSGWYGPDKTRPFPALAVRRLIARGFLYRCSPNAARLTPVRGTRLARTLCSQIAAASADIKIIRAAFDHGVGAGLSLAAQMAGHDRSLTP